MEWNFMGLKQAQKRVGKNVIVIVRVCGKYISKQSSIILEVEDATASFKALVMEKNENAYKKAKAASVGDELIIKGDALKPFIVVEELNYISKKGEVRDRKRIPRILGKLRVLWELNSNSRFGQNLCNWLYLGDRINFEEEDDVLEKRLDESTAKLKKLMKARK